MASITLVRHPFRPDEKELFLLPAGTRVELWLARQALPGNPTLWLNGERITSAEFVLLDDDHLAVVVIPSDPVTAFLAFYIGNFAATIVVSALIGLAVNMVVGALFKPKRPGETPAASPVYSIGGGQNAARLGEPIPVIYGEIVAIPDYATQPYVEYGVGDPATGLRSDTNDQWLNATLCIGEGEYEVLDVMVAGSSTKSLGNNVIQYNVFSSAEHGQRMGVIRSATSVWENVYTPAEVSDQELIAPNEEGGSTTLLYYWKAINVRDVPGFVPSGLPGTLALRANATAAIGTIIKDLTTGHGTGGLSNPTHQIADFIATAPAPIRVTAPDILPALGIGGSAPRLRWIGPFESCLASQSGQRLEFDFIFAGGLVKIDGNNLKPATVVVKVEATPIDANDVPTGAAITMDYTFTASSNTPRRYTRSLTVPSGRYLVRAHRVTDKDKSISIIDRVVWSGLKFYLNETPAATPVYGNTTIMVVRIKASNGIGGNATSQISARVKRKLPRLGVGAPVATANPVDAFIDILTADYGGRRPLNDAEMDLTHLATLHTLWQNANGFNGAFDQHTTVYEALQAVLQCVGAGPLPIGSRMLVMEDKVKPIRVMMFSEANIVASTLEIGFDWNKEGEPTGVRVEFRDPATFKPDFIIEPPDSLDYQSLSLFGCTSKQTALEYARGVLDKRALQRQTVSFDTEMEGLLLLPGERFALSHTMPRWGTVGFATSVVGNTIEIDRPLPWRTGQQHVVILRNSAGEPSAPINVTQGADIGTVVLASMPFPVVLLGADREPTHIVFGVKDKEVTDWICTGIAPAGESRVRVEGQIYAPGAYARAQPHQRT